MSQYDVDFDEELTADADAREADRLYPYRYPDAGPTLREQCDAIQERIKAGECYDHDGESVDTWPRYLNAYTQERRYGGPEEGGWYYDACDPVTDGTETTTASDGFTALATYKVVSVKVWNAEQIDMAWPAFEKRIDDAVDLEEDRVLVYLEGAPAWFTPRPHYE